MRPIALRDDPVERLMRKLGLHCDVQFQTALRDALNDLLESHTGTSPKLAGYTGSKPTNISDAATGTKLFEITLPSDWMGASSSGVKSMSGTWQDSAADNTGTVGYWELRKSDDTVIMRGSVGVGSGELQFLTTSITAGQPINVTAFAFTAPGAT